MSDWINNPKDLAHAMSVLPLAEAWIKAVKAAVKAKLLDDPKAVPGFKLRNSGSMTYYESTEVAEILMETNILEWSDLLASMRFSVDPVVKIWADKTGMSKTEARRDIKERLREVAKTKPKSPSIMRNHDAK